MKRSEMVDFIMNELELHLQHRAPRFAVVSDLLAKIEEKMLPPFNNHMCYMDGDNANQESVVYCVWDDE